MELSLTYPAGADVQSIADGHSKALGPLEAPSPDAVRAIQQKQDVGRCGAPHHWRQEQMQG